MDEDGNANARESTQGSHVNKRWGSCIGPAKCFNQEFTSSTLHTSPSQWSAGNSGLIEDPPQLSVCRYITPYLLSICSRCRSKTESWPSRKRLGWYRSAVLKHPFVLFGLPFLAIIISGSFFLTPATALRYEKHDQKKKWLNKDEALSSTGNLTRRKVDPREEYYVSLRRIGRLLVVADEIAEVGGQRPR